MVNITENPYDLSLSDVIKQNKLKKAQNTQQRGGKGKGKGVKRTQRGGVNQRQPNSYTGE